MTEPVSSSKPTVALLCTGGTLTSLGENRLDLISYGLQGKRLSPAEVLQRIPELGGVCQARVLDFPQTSSSGLTVAHWLQANETLHEALIEGGCVGAVVVHGTNTLEESAYFLSLTMKTDAPVVLVGAMRPPSGLGADGDLNLFNAFRVAASESARGLGALVVIEGRIHAARDVTKTSTSRIDAFISRNTGPVGYADPDQVVIYARPVRRHTTATPFDVRGRTSLPDVRVITSYLGEDGTLIDAAVAAGAEGIVYAGTGMGKCSAAEYAALQRARDSGVAVVMSSRVGSGRVVARPDLRERAIVAADDLLPWKARILLMLGLTVSRDYDDLQAMFQQF